MAVRRSKFAPPVTPRNRRSPTRMKTFTSTGGLNLDQLPQILPIDQSPDLLNFNIYDGYIEPRSGLSTGFLSSSGSTGAAFNGDYIGLLTTIYDRHGGQHLLAISAKTLIDVRPYDGNPQSANYGYLDPKPATVPYNTDVQPVAIFSEANATGSPGYPHGNAIFGSALDSTGAISLFEYSVDAPVSAASHGYLLLASSNNYIAGAMGSVDERLMAFGLYSWGSMHQPSSRTAHMNRVYWSARGDPIDITTNGGFQDLANMSGYPTGLAVDVSNRVLLFTNEEVWTANPRRDAYAFDFNLLKHGVGAIQHKSIVATPEGVFYMGPANRLYRINGNRVSEVDTGIKGLLSTLSSVHTIFGAYDKARNAYVLFYGSNTSVGASQAVSARLDTIKTISDTVDKMVWEKHEWPGFDFTAATPWTPAFINPSRFSSYATYFAQGEQDPWLVLGTSTGSLYAMISGLTNDDGSAFTAHYRSPMIPSAFPLGTVSTNEVWVEALPSGSTSTVEVLTSTDRAALVSQGNISLSSTTELGFLSPAPSAGRYTQTELRITDGSRPQIAHTILRLRDYTGRHG